MSEKQTRFEEEQLKVQTWASEACGISQENFEQYRADFETTLECLGMESGDRCTFIGIETSLYPLEFALLGYNVNIIFSKNAFASKYLYFQELVSNSRSAEISSAGGSLDTQIVDVFEDPQSMLPKADVVIAPGMDHRHLYDLEYDDCAHSLIGMGNRPRAKFLLSRATGIQGRLDPFIDFFINEAIRIGHKAEVLHTALCASELYPTTKNTLIEIEYKKPEIK